MSSSLIQNTIIMMILIRILVNIGENMMIEDKLFKAI